MLDRLARLVHARPRAFVIVALLAFLAAGALGAGVAERLVPYEAEDPDTQSAIADQRLERAGAFDADVVLLVDGVDVRSLRGRERVATLSKQVAADPGVVRMRSFVDTRSPDFVARDGDATYLAVQLEGADNMARQAAAKRLVADLADEPGVRLGGPVVADLEINDTVASDLRRAELIAFPILAAFAFLFFRSVVAALLPLLVGVLAIVGTSGLLFVVSELRSVSVFALNLVAALGLALAIDYSLFIVARYREEVGRGGRGLDAMRRTMATAGRTVLFSSLTVAATTGSLIVFPQNILSSMGVGGALVALLAGVIALTVLPAVLVLLGPRIDALAPAALQRRADREARPAQDGAWYRLAGFVVRRPGRVAALSAALLVVLSIPAFGITFNASDAQALPTATNARQVDDALRADFRPYRTTPVTVAVRGAARVERVAAAAARLPGVAEVQPPVALRGDLHAISVISSTPPLAEASKDLVRDLRALGGEVQVTGYTARFLDLQESLFDHAPILLLLVSAITLGILFLFTGSVVLPVKQLAMNLLGLGAVFGIIVLVFQDGRLEGVLGYTSQGAIEVTQPILPFALGFGLATDYGLFLLSRIKEARDQGHDDRLAIALGLERTGRIVTAAALLFAVAVGAFAASQIVFVKQIGLGIALAVLIDATIIRALLVPSLMMLLGRWNWWAPGPLRRLHAKVGLNEALAPVLPEPSRVR